MRRLWPALRWVLLGAAAVLLVVFVLAQRQRIDVSYGQSPSTGDSVEEGSAGELTDATLPSVERMSAMLGQDPVLALPGAVAHWDERRVAAAAGTAEVRILAAPPGLTEDQRDRIRDVETATIRIVGTETSGGVYQAVSDDLAGWRSQFATGDVTSLIETLLAADRDEDPPEDDDLMRWRAPTDAELSTVADDLRATRLHVAPGATLDRIPANADEDMLFVALPQQPFGEPVPEYGPALTELFADTPIFVMYGSWVEYHGPDAAEFADVVGGSFYGEFGDRLSRYAYPQGNVLHSYLDRVTDVRYAGLFDRPLPYQPFDPLRVALPALPWLFAVCVLGFLLLSARSLLGSARAPGKPPARLAGLTTLAIELSALSHHPSLTRGIGKLKAAREALAEELPDRHVRRLLDDAQHELDVAARKLGRADYRPRAYLAGGLS